MNTTILKTIGRFARSHKKAILTGVSILGVGASTALAAKAGYKFAIDVENIESETKTKLDKKAKYKLAAKTFALPVGTAAATIGTIIVAQKVNAKELAALGGAYTMLSKKYGSLQKAVGEIEDTEVVQKIRDKMAKEISENEEIKTGKREQIASMDKSSDDLDILNFSDKFMEHWEPDFDGVYYEPISGRYFGCSETKLKEAVNQTNEDMLNSYSQNLNDLYANIDSPDLEPNDAGYMLGWEFNSTGLIQYTLMKDESRFTIIRGTKYPVKTIDFMNGPQYTEY